MAPGGLHDGLKNGTGLGLEFLKPHHHEHLEWSLAPTWRRKWQLFQFPCLGNPMDRGAWWATVHGVAKSQTQLSD